ncbi:MAG TPA: hypothetical protein VG895_03585 [Patescibacteria group bacterium]|nr:hypothetical protein [Patescibacteria group bacterium]
MEPADKILIAKEEKTDKIDYPFLTKLTEDYPNSSAKLKEQIPKWKAGVDKLSGIPGLGNELLQTMDYVSKSEEEKYFIDTASEIQSILERETKDKVYFVSLGKEGGSGPYISDQIKAKLPENLRDRVESLLSTRVDINTHTKENQGKNGIHYFICDDSANSGRQLESCLGAFDWYARKNSERRLFDRAKDINVHIRMMRIADPAVGIISKYVDKAKNSHLHIDNKSPRMPLTSDALFKIGANPSKLSQEAQNAILYTHHNWEGAILGFFYHKIQDNLPPILIPGRNRYESLTPLLSDTEVIKPYQ